MFMPNPRFLLAALLTLTLLPVTASAQLGGVRVKTGDVDVKVDGGTTDVRTGKTTVKTEDGKATIRDEKRAKRRGKADKAKPRVERPVHSPVVCNGADDVTIENKTIRGDVTVESNGACSITIRNCKIEAKKTGVILRGSGDINVINSEIKSRGVALQLDGAGNINVRNSKVKGKTAISLTGSGDLITKNSRFKGAKKMSGAGEIRDQGESHFLK